MDGPAPALGTTPMTRFRPAQFLVLSLTLFLGAALVWSAIRTRSTPLPEPTDRVDTPAVTKRVPPPQPLDALGKTTSTTVDTASPAATVAGTKVVTESPDDPSAEDGTLTGREAIESYLGLLRAGLTKLEAVADYRATFERHERIDGVLREPEVCDLSIRHAPFSVAMKWRTGDKGRRAVFVDGANDGLMLVRLGGWKSRLPAIKVGPVGDAARASARHPITQSGLLALANRLAHHREADLVRGDGCTCKLRNDHVWNDRPCYEFVVEYSGRSVTESVGAYRKSIQCLDQELLLPLHVRNFGWPHDGDDTESAIDDEATFVESYVYADLVFDVGLGDDDFDVSKRERRER